jgi:hypothetical protein
MMELTAREVWMECAKTWIMEESMRRVGIVFLVLVLTLSLPAAADVRSDLRKVHRECEDGHRDLARTLQDIDERLDRLERLLTERR